MRVSRIPILCLWAALVAAMIHVGSPATMVRAAEAKPKKKDTLAKLQPKEVTYEAKLEPAEAKPGEQVKYSVTLKIDEPWHCYGSSRSSRTPGRAARSSTSSTSAGWSRPKGSGSPRSPPRRSWIRPSTT